VTQPVAEIVSHTVVHPVQESVSGDFQMTISKPQVEFVEPVVCIVAHPVMQLMAEPVAETDSQPEVPLILQPELVSFVEKLAKPWWSALSQWHRWLNGLR
jgi:hypothetical protein